MGENIVKKIFVIKIGGYYVKSFTHKFRKEIHLTKRVDEAHEFSTLNDCIERIKSFEIENYKILEIELKEKEFYCDSKTL